MKCRGKLSKLQWLSEERFTSEKPDDGGVIIVAQSRRRCWLSKGDARNAHAIAVHQVYAYLPTMMRLLWTGYAWSCISMQMSGWEISDGFAPKGQWETGLLFCNYYFTESPFQVEERILWHNKKGVSLLLLGSRVFEHGLSHVWDTHKNECSWVLWKPLGASHSVFSLKRFVSSFAEWPKPWLNVLQRFVAPIEPRNGYHAPPPCCIIFNCLAILFRFLRKTYQMWKVPLPNRRLNEVISASYTQCCTAINRLSCHVCAARCWCARCNALTANYANRAAARETSSMNDGCVIT